ncbi:hypothetical protein HK096_007226, partial [Nowakowskiella sp. JEL0078]
FVAFVINNVLVKLYHQGIHIREAEFMEVRKYAEIAQRRKQSMIFLPCHKSHVDYLVISYIFYRLGLALPHIAAGDNLHIPIVGWLLKHAGAFFIRRSWGDDPIYSTIMKEYIEILLERGHNIEAFIEGTRSRVGKLLTPKFGILKIILEAIMSSKVDDCIIVPIYIGYDRVLESSSYISELLGSPKQKESLKQLWESSGILQLKWGRIDIRFSQPFSMRNYIDLEINRKGPNFSPVYKFEDKSYMLMNLGYKILSSINSVSVIMPTSLVGTALLTLRGRGVGRDELIRKVETLKQMIENKGGKVCDFYGTPSIVIVERAIQNLKDLVGHRTDLLESVYYPVKRFELSFYRNQVIHLFIQEAIVSVALYSKVKMGGPTSDQRILYKTPKRSFKTSKQLEKSLLSETEFLSSLLRQEFVYGQKPLIENLEETVNSMVKNEVIILKSEINTFCVDQNDESVSNTWVSISDKERSFGRENFGTCKGFQDQLKIIILY